MAVQVKQLKATRPVAPIGVVKSKGLDPAEWPSCGPRVVNSKDEVVEVGCGAWDLCALKFKGEGPRNGGVRIVAPRTIGGKARELQLPCYDFNTIKEKQELQGYIVKWIGDEGSKITVKGSERNNPADSTQGYRPFVREEEVTAHPTLENSFELADAVYEAQLRQKQLEELRRERELEVAGITEDQIAGTETPTHEPEKPVRRK